MSQNNQHPHKPRLNPVEKYQLEQARLDRKKRRRQERMLSPEKDKADEEQTEKVQNQLLTYI